MRFLKKYPKTHLMDLQNAKLIFLFRELGFYRMGSVAKMIPQMGVPRICAILLQFPPLMMYRISSTTSKHYSPTFWQPPLSVVSFSELFNTDRFDNDQNDADDSSIKIFLQGICVMCQGFTFVLSLCVTMLSSSALVRHLTATFDPYAENGYELLIRVFHFEFLCVRWCSNTAMFVFLLAVGCKILYDYRLFDIDNDGFEDWQLEIGIPVVLIMSALTLHLMAYLTSTLVVWDNIWGTIIDLVKASVHRGFNEDQPMEALSFAILGVGMIVLSTGLMPGTPI